jgi:hypothetical protein
VFEDVLPKLRSQGLYAVRQQNETIQEYELREAELIKKNKELLKQLSFAGECCDYPTLLTKYEGKFNLLNFDIPDFCDWLRRTHEVNIYIHPDDPEQSGTRYTMYNQEYQLNKTENLKDWLVEYFCESKRSYAKHNVKQILEDNHRKVVNVPVGYKEPWELYPNTGEIYRPLPGQ